MNPTPDGDLFADTRRYGKPPSGWRRRLYAVIFEADTPAGRAFDLTLIWLIVTSVAVVMLDSIASVRARWGPTLTALEWFFTLVFTLEYLARLACVQRPGRYASSTFGVIDLVAVLPTWLAFFFPAVHSLIDVRVLRLLRLFRLLKLAAYVREFSALGAAVYASRRKIGVFLAFVLMIVTIAGTLMYVVEGPANGYTSIPISIYWAITTMTTVGFGDITPKTDLGRFIASFMMLVGWGTLAVPTGIVSAEFTAQRFGALRGWAGERAPPPRVCAHCGSEGHAAAARYCCDCGAALPRAGDVKAP